MVLKTIIQANIGKYSCCIQKTSHTSEVANGGVCIFCLLSVNSFLCKSNDVLLLTPHTKQF